MRYMRRQVDILPINTHNLSLNELHLALSYPYGRKVGGVLRDGVVGTLIVAGDSVEGTS